MAHSLPGPLDELAGRDASICETQFAARPQPAATVSVRVPVLIAGPGVPRDKQISELTGNSDLAATVVGATGATPRRTLDGVSLVDVALAPSQYGGRPILLANGPSGGPASPRYTAIRTSAHKYVEYVSGEPRLIVGLRAAVGSGRSRADGAATG